MADENKSSEATAAEPVVNKSENKDVEDNKVYAILAYFGLLVLVPILAAKDSKFAMYHANQGVILLIGGVILSAVTAVPILGWLLGLVAWPAYLVFAILGILNAANGKMKPLPLVGDIKIIK